MVFLKNYFNKWVNFDEVFRYVPIKLDQNPGNFLKAKTISNQRFLAEWT